MAKKELHYIIRNPGQLNKRFYDGFDHNFLFRKAQTLAFLLDQQENFKSLVKQAEENCKDREDAPLLSEDVNDKYFEELRAEIYFTEMHQFESFFALLLAYFKEIPDWLYLTTYKTEEIKTAIQNYVDNNISAVTDGKADNAHFFLVYAMYAGFYSIEMLNDTTFNTSVSDIDWFLKRIAQRYLEAVEYNAYKHGLRVLTGHSRLVIRLNDAAGNPQGQGFVLGDSEDSLSFLKLEDKGEGGKTVAEVTKHFNPKESFEHIRIMHLILEEVMRTRRARVNQENLDHVQTIFIKRDELQAMRKHFTFSFDV